MYQAIYIQQGENYAKTVHLKDDNEGSVGSGYIRVGQNGSQP